METHIYAFEKLTVWEDIRTLNKMVYSLTASFPDNEKFGLVSQLRRASISIGSNLAEGSTRTSSKDQAHFYQIAYSSSIEVLSQLVVSYDLNIIAKDDYVQVRDQIEKICYKLNSLRKSILQRNT
jgi:four helix bundle protein